MLVTIIAKIIIANDNNFFFREGHNQIQGRSFKRRIRYLSTFAEVCFKRKSTFTKVFYVRNFAFIKVFYIILRELSVLTMANA